MTPTPPEIVTTATFLPVQASSDEYSNWVGWWTMFYPDSAGHPDGLIRIHTPPGLKMLTQVSVNYQNLGWDTLDPSDYPVGVIIGCTLNNSQYGQLRIPGDSIITIAFSLGIHTGSLVLGGSPLGYTFTVSLMYSDLSSETKDVTFPSSGLTTAFSSCPNVSSSTASTLATYC